MSSRKKLLHRTPNRLESSLSAVSSTQSDSGQKLVGWITDLGAIRVQHQVERIRKRDFVFDPGGSVGHPRSHQVQRVMFVQYL